MPSTLLNPSITVFEALWQIFYANSQHPVLEYNQPMVALHVPTRGASCSWRDASDRFVLVTVLSEDRGDLK